MSAVVVDTSCWISYLRGLPQPHLREALAEGRVIVPPLVVAELFSGRLRPVARTALYDALRRLHLCDCPFDHWIRVGELRIRLAEKGLSMSTPDAHVAQCCVDNNADLLTADKIFRLVAPHIPLKILQQTRAEN